MASLATSARAAELGQVAVRTVEMDTRGATQRHLTASCALGGSSAVRRQRVFTACTMMVESSCSSSSTSAGTPPFAPICGAQNNNDDKPCLIGVERMTVLYEPLTRAH